MAAVSDGSQAGHNGAEAGQRLLEQKPVSGNWSSALTILKTALTGSRPASIASPLASSGLRPGCARGGSHNQTTTTSVEARIYHAVIAILFARGDPAK
jgi:hypothetical protein